MLVQFQGGRACIHSSKCRFFHFFFQPDMYGRMGSPSTHGYPDPHGMPSYQGLPGYNHPQQYPSSYPYGSPMPMMVDRGGGGGGGGGGGRVDGYNDGMVPGGSQSGSPGLAVYPSSDPWRRSSNRVWRTVSSRNMLFTFVAVFKIAIYCIYGMYMYSHMACLH